MADFSSLEISKRALLVQRMGLNLTSNNIANVNTPNYSRRDAVLQETTPQLNSGAFMGTGVLIDKLRSYRDEFFDKEIRVNISRTAGFEADEKLIKRIESLLAEPTDIGLNELVAKFFNSFEELSLKPDNVANRQNVLSSAKLLIDRLHSTHSQLNDFRETLLGDTSQKIEEANKLIQNIVALNKNIANSKAIGGVESQTYVDQRAEMLERLSSLFNITVTYENNGTSNVFINGMNIITGTNYNSLKLLVDVNALNGEKTARIVKMDNKNNIIGAINPHNGEVASLLKGYNVILDERDTTNGFSIIKSLNEFAANLVQKVNTLTINGFGLDDIGPTPPGRNFFEPIVGQVTAGNIRLSADIENNPRNIPISDSPMEPGNNAIALLIAKLSNDNSFLAGQTPGNYVTGVLGQLGNIGYEAISGRRISGLISEQLISQRESIIGVNLDEEAVNLIKFQKAFEAAARVVNTTNELLATVINLGR